MNGIKRLEILKRTDMANVTISIKYEVAYALSVCIFTFNL